MTPRHREVVKHIRKRIRIASIAARCRGFVSCGVQFIQVNVPKADVEFSEAEQLEIRWIAKVNHLTFSRGMEINVNQMTNPKVFDFVLPSSTEARKESPLSSVHNGEPASLTAEQGLIVKGGTPVIGKVSPEKPSDLVGEGTAAQ